MRWSLFLDDERFPVMTKSYDCDWIIARTPEDAFWLIENFGMPRRMSIDHDLGENVGTGYDFIKSFVNKMLDDNTAKDATVIDVYVHSQNPVGAENIRVYWKNFIGSVTHDIKIK